MINFITGSEIENYQFNLNKYNKRILNIITEASLLTI